MTDQMMIDEARKLLARVDQDEAIRRRVVQDALQQATGRYWLNRAKTFEDARSRPGDFLGQATPDQVAARDHELYLTALACRQKAALMVAGWLDD